MGQHVAVVVSVDVNHFLPLHGVGSEEVEVDAERLLANLGEHVFVLAEFAVDPLTLDDGAGIVLDVGADAGEAPLGQFECRLQRMGAGGRGHRIASVGVALGQAAIRQQSRAQLRGSLSGGSQFGWSHGGLGGGSGHLAVDGGRSSENGGCQHNNAATEKRPCQTGHLSSSMDRNRYFSSSTPPTAGHERSRNHPYGLPIR